MLWALFPAAQLDAAAFSRVPTCPPVSPVLRCNAREFVVRNSDKKCDSQTKILI
jgi:hypothetical protein